MIIATLTKTTKVSKEKIWQLYSDVSKWSKWDSEVEHSSLNGEFEIGSTGKIQPTKGPLANFQITELTYLKSFTATSFLPLSKLHFVHHIEPNQDGYEITHQIEITGLTASIFGLILGKTFKAGLQKTMEGLMLRLTNEK